MIIPARTPDMFLQSTTPFSRPTLVPIYLQITPCIWQLNRWNEATESQPATYISHNWITLCSCCVSPGPVPAQCFDGNPPRNNSWRLGFHGTLARPSVYREGRNENLFAWLVFHIENPNSPNAQIASNNAHVLFSFEIKRHFLFHSRHFSTYLTNQPSILIWLTNQT